MFRLETRMKTSSASFPHHVDLPHRLSTAYMYHKMNWRGEAVHREVAESRCVYIVKRKGFSQFVYKLRLVSHVVSHFRRRYEDSSGLWP